jgi:beta-galactosidase
MKPQLGTCYYPEHWPQGQWKEDAKRMADLGLKIVRVGEFAWSRFEAMPGKLTFDWMDQALDTLGAEGLNVVMCTPTATPPRWMLDKHPDMLAVDAGGHVRKFGSRRHYCFSHLAYRQESVRIARIMAEHFATHEAITAWQIDNEYSCHNTVVSYSDAALREFHNWLEAKYETINQLNQAWGNVFWSMEYGSFSQIELPNQTVTEPNPSHCLDFQRFSSDQVVAYNKAQADAIRKHAFVPLIHNYMGRIVDFDHFKVGEDLDIASWDSYPLGFLVDRTEADDEWKKRFERQGDPDLQAFHHDLYRAVGKGRWWVMEQQPGPVNWAPNNPAPLDGMVRLWTFEAIAHQAEAVCYFRWRQAPFAQEQMHAGLLRPDSQPAAVFDEVARTANEIEQLGDIQATQAKVALIFDYESCWAWQIQPQGEDFDNFVLCLEFYRGLRRNGLSVDILPPTVDSLDGYAMILAPGLMTWPDQLLLLLETFTGIALLGPRSGSKSKNMTIPTSLPPAIPNFDCKVSYVETFSRGSDRSLVAGGAVRTWQETVETTEAVSERTVDGSAVLIGDKQLRYLAAWPETEAMTRILGSLAVEAGLEVISMPEGVRRRCTGSHEFVFNHNAEAVKFRGQSIEAAGVLIKALD